MPRVIYKQRICSELEACGGSLPSAAMGDQERPRVPDRPGLHVDSIMESLLLQMPAGLASKLEIVEADCSEMNQLVQV